MHKAVRKKKYFKTNEFKEQILVTEFQDFQS